MALRIFSQRNSIQLNIIAIIVGVVAGYGAIGFRYLIGFMQNVFFHHKLDFHLISPLNHVAGNWIVIIPPLGILAAATLVWHFAREAKGHGVPEVIEAVIAHNGYIRKRVAIIKALASSLTIAAGGSVGREGPIVQIGAAFGSAIGRIFKYRTKYVKVLVGCGAAGAISATFNTPIAAVIFAIELIVLEFRAKSFIPLVISSVFAAATSRYHLGNHVAFHVPAYAYKHPIELLFYLGLGVLAAFVSYLTIKTLYSTEDFFDRWKVPFYIKAIIGGLIIGVVGIYFPQIFGVGYESVEAVLLEKSTFKLMMALIFIKIIMMSITIGAGGSGGVFAPSLFIGAMLGGSYGMLINNIFPDVTAGYGAYALVGMATLFAANSRATFTAIVILFEMTLDYQIILPLMFACVIADQFSHILLKDNSIYSIKLKRKGYSLIEGFGVDVFRVTPIRDIMCTDLRCLENKMTLKEAQIKIIDSPHSIYPVVNDEGILFGMIRSNDIEYELINSGPDSKVEDFMLGTPTAVGPSETVYNALRKLQKSRDPRIVIVDPYTKHLLGIACPADFIRLSALNAEEEM